MSDTNEMAQTGAERRRTQRMSLPFRIEVCGREPMGTVFQEQTTTIDVNEHGCKFDLERRLNRGDLVTIRHVLQEQNPSKENRLMLFQVVWSEISETGSTVGVMKLQDESMWPMAFPAQSASRHLSSSPS